MTHIERVLKHLNKKGSITSMDAFKRYGITRLSSIIHTLRNKYDIETVEEVSKNRYGENTRYARYYFKGELKK